VLFVPDADTTELFFPIVPFLGLEIGLADDVNAFALGSFGPGIHVHEPEAGLESALEARLGIEYLL